jgi:hypothetical protein
MILPYLEPAADWLDQSVEERLILAAELLFTQNLMNSRRYNQATMEIRKRANRQRSIRTRNRIDTAVRQAGAA